MSSADGLDSQVAEDPEHIRTTQCREARGGAPAFVTKFLLELVEVFVPEGSTFEAVMSMAAAERGVLVAPEILFHDRTIGVNVYILDRSKGEHELFLIRRNTSESTATVDNFVQILAESVLRLQTRCQNAKASYRGTLKVRTQRGEGAE
jgi:DNA-binding transcriptional LysR family regulator